MRTLYGFDADVLHSVAGGRSAIDIPKLNIHNDSEAEAFLHSYGFDLKRAGDEDKLWYFYRRALVLLTERLGFQESEIPEALRDRRHLQDIRLLLLWASSARPHDRDLQRWSCAILRCMHVYVHAESDLFSFFSEEIQAQVLGSFQQSVVHDGTRHKTYLKRSLHDRDAVELVGFHMKPFKNSQSTVIKLLAKPDALAMKVFDKLGVRFITKNLFDTFRVIRALVEESLISYPHIMPDQSSNNLYPVDLFVKVCEKIESMPVKPDDERIEELFQKELAAAGGDAILFRKANEQSDTQFQFIKFITRKLIEVNIPGRDSFSFFYPFEVQILDARAHERALSGPSEHEAYKERQRQAARRRLFPETSPP
ncbi:MAG: TIGR04552 family protein [Bdellovibrionaceae bacterium]|nr:TIGR04552 family protein [Pseudobdellovibrionaceae bacterium]MBX3034745.1 TIGR04552 family protein [Pseudobdellovibrionaceae bacterium]